eukprot:3323859-Pleurochrysis_carterae.AAC.2
MAVLSACAGQNERFVLVRAASFHAPLSARAFAQPAWLIYLAVTLAGIGVSQWLLRRDGPQHAASFLIVAGAHARARRPARTRAQTSTHAHARTHAHAPVLTSANTRAHTQQHAQSTRTARAQRVPYARNWRDDGRVNMCACRHSGRTWALLPWLLLASAPVSAPASAPACADIAGGYTAPASGALACAPPPNANTSAPEQLKACERCFDATARRHGGGGCPAAARAAPACVRAGRAALLGHGAGDGHHRSRPNGLYQQGQAHRAPVHANLAIRAFACSLARMHSLHECHESRDSQSVNAHEQDMLEVAARRMSRRTYERK